jgi:ABC-type branched-subunit amino acid transport system substrate-binding protein
LRQSRPQAIFVNLAVEQSGITIRKIRELGLSQPLFSNFWGATAEVRKAAGAANIAGLQYVTIDVSKPVFSREMSNLFPGTSLTAISYSCFAATRAVLLAVERLGLSKPISAASLHQALSSLPLLDLPDEGLEIKNRELQFKLTLGRVK